LLANPKRLGGDTGSPYIYGHQLENVTNFFFFHFFWWYGGFNSENVVFTYVEFYSATKKNKILSFAGKWMELENIILSEVSQAQKAKSCMLSFICTYMEYRPNTNTAIL
jgi:hypothetical protein